MRCCEDFNESQLITTCVDDLDEGIMYNLLNFGDVTKLGGNVSSEEAIERF